MKKNLNSEQVLNSDNLIISNDILLENTTNQKLEKVSDNNIDKYNKNHNAILNNIIIKIQMSLIMIKAVLNLTPPEKINILTIQLVVSIQNQLKKILMAVHIITIIN